jgi:hypothetical protein
MDVHRDRLEEQLEAEFECSPGERRAVVRAIGDLADSDRYEEDAGRALTPDLVVDELQEAPAELGLAERWNWWLGSLEFAYGNYEIFRVRRWHGDDR